MFGIWSGNGVESHHYNTHFGISSNPHTRSHPTSSNLSHISKEDLGQVQVQTSEGKFLVKLDTAGYYPEELEIKTQDGFLIIQGQTMDREVDAVKTERKFRRRFLLPINCKEDELTCQLGGRGQAPTILKVTIARDVPDGKGKLHQIEMSTFGLIPSHITHPFSALHEHDYNHGNQTLNVDPVRGVEINRERFVLRLDLLGYAPDELVVKTVDDFLLVEGDFGEREEENGGAFASCSFSRRYLLPVNVDVDKMTCEINEDGRLKVIIPRINLEKMEKIHKIEMTSRKNGVTNGIFSGK